MTPLPALWCIRIPGPDELVAAHSHAGAVLLANVHDAAVERMDRRTRGCGDTHAPREGLFAEVIHWPHSAEAHTAALVRQGRIDE